MANPQRRSYLISEAMGDGLGVFDPQRQQAHVLNATSALIFQHCDGQTTPQQLAERLRRKFNVPASQAEQLLWLALDELQKAHLLQGTFTTQAPQPMSTRRQVLTGFAAAGLSLALLPLVSPVKAAQAESTTTTTPAPPTTTSVPPPTTTAPPPTTTTTTSAPSNVTDQIIKTRTGLTFNAAADPPYATLGTYTLVFNYTNNTGYSLRNVYYQVVAVSNASLMNADGAPGGLHAKQTVPNSTLPGGDNIFQHTEILSNQTHIVGVSGKPWALTIGIFGVDSTARSNNAQMIDTITFDSDQFHLADQTLFLPFIQR